MPENWFEETGRQLYESRESGDFAPLLSELRPGSSMADGYKAAGVLVRHLVSGSGGRPVGLKAALTGELARKKFGLDQPVFGVFTESMLYRPGAEIILSSFRRPMLEVEIAFILKSKVTAPLAGAREAAELVGSVAAAVEIPDNYFQDISRVKGPDLAANNANAAGVILGRPVPFSEARKLSEARSRLIKDGQVVSQGQGRDAMGDPLKSLLWLLNEALANGVEIPAQTFAITGVLGPITPAEPGVYRAEIEGLTGIDFKIVE